MPQYQLLIIKELRVIKSIHMTGWYKKIFYGLVLGYFFIFPFSARAVDNKPLASELEQIYNRYSYYLDTKWDGLGWQYSVPSGNYLEIDKYSADTIRQQLSLATFYRFRSDQEALAKIHQAVTYTWLEVVPAQANKVVLNGKPVSTRSFNEAIGIFLTLRIFDTHNELFTLAEKEEILLNIKKMYPYVLQANDTENRAFLSAAYSLAILNHPLLQFTEVERESYLKIINHKVGIGLKTVDKYGVYREGKPAVFSAHYQLVAANMLSYLGSELDNIFYSTKAKLMHNFLVRKFPLGKISDFINSRPQGVGLQTVLLRTVSQNYINNSDWREFWQQENSDKGFIDPNNPDRLVWRDQSDGTYNDDYSFANMAELFWPWLE
jgi:hypothetical protein